MKKLLCAFLSFSLFAAPAAQAVDFETLGNIDALMEDNSLTEVVNRYGAVQLSFFPEEATRLGFESANNKLDQRTPERDAQALRAFNIVEESLSNIRRENLSELKKTEYDILKGRLAYERWLVNKNRTAVDPLLYANVLRAIYDLRLKELNYKDLQDRDLTARVNELSTVAKQAQTNLTNAPSFLSQIAMEDAYYAYLGFDDIAQYLLSRAQDDVSRSQVRADARESKKAIKDLFELFKKLAQENNEIDFRLNEKDYFFTLKNLYFIEQKPRAMERFLNKNFLKAQENLAKALEAFSLPVAMQEAELILEDIQVPVEENAEEVVVAEENLLPTENSEEKTTENAPNQPKEEKKKKGEKEPVVLASDFYATLKRIQEPVEDQNFIQTINEEASRLMKFFIQDGSLPSAMTKIHLKELPAYFSYTKTHLFLPPFGTQGNPTHDFFLRLPKGNEITKQEMLNRDFNLPTLKLLIAGQLIPGKAYRSAYSFASLSPFRKLYVVPTLQNGWEVYAQHLAQERGYLVTEEDLLFLAWADYVRAAQALVDFYLHTQKFTYSQALNWLVEENGFEQAQAENMLKQIAASPAKALSYIYGYDAIKTLRNKYQKKLGKKFSLSDFNAKLLEVGNIPPYRLETEVDYAYKAEKSQLTKALNTPFYMD